MTSIEADGAEPTVLGFSLPRAGLAAASLVILLGLHLGFSRTRWSMALRATSRDLDTAALVGVDTPRVARSAFELAAALAGSAGALFAAIHYLHPAADVDLTLLAITLAIGTGPGRVGALLAAGLGLGLVEAMTMATLGPRWRELAVALGLAILAAGQHVRTLLRVTHRAYVLDAGRVVATGPGRALLEHPDVRRTLLDPRQEA